MRATVYMAAEVGVIMHDVARLTLETAPAAGAIAVLSLTGPTKTVRDTVSRHVQFGHAADGALARRLRVGVWRTTDGLALDQVVVVWRSATHVEFHCHGGRGVVAGIVETLRRTVASLEIAAPTPSGWPISPSWGDPRRLSSTYRRALSLARTARMARALVAQLELVPTWLAALGAANERQIPTLLATAREGLGLAKWIEREPPRVVICGAPNAGKSTLFNTLVEQDRAIVSPVPGTTRDVLEAVIAVQGVAVKLCDTAGLNVTANGVRFATDRLERRGQVQTLRALRGADVALLLVDGRHAVTPEAVAMATRVFQARQTLVARSKADLANGSDDEPGPPAGFPVAVSAHTGAGMANLLDQLATLLRIPPPTPNIPLIPLSEFRIRLSAETDAWALSQALRQLTW